VINYKEKVEETKEELKKKLEYTKGIIDNYEKGTNFKVICICIVCCFIAFATGYFLGIRNSVSSEGNGIDTVKEQFGKLEKNQQGITSGITNATNTSTELTETINVSFEAVGRLEDSIRVGQKQVEELGKSVDRVEINVRESGKLIEGSESIIREILSRGEKNKVEN